MQVSATVVRVLLCVRHLAGELLAFMCSKRSRSEGFKIRAYDIGMNNGRLNLRSHLRVCLEARGPGTRRSCEPFQKRTPDQQPCLVIELGQIIKKGVSLYTGFLFGSKMKTTSCRGLRAMRASHGSTAPLTSPALPCATDWGSSRC